MADTQTSSVDRPPRTVPPHLHATSARIVTSGRRPSSLLALGSLSVFLGLSLTCLDRFPVAIQDEPWIVAPALKLALHGVYGSNLFAGYYGAGQHYYQSMPAYPLLVAASFKVLGVGLVQARLVSVVLGSLSLAFTYLVGRRLVGETPAAIATALLVLWRVTTWGPVFGSGIPLLDLSREARYDVAVVPLVLLACAFVVVGLERRNDGLVSAAGFATGLAALCQLYGAFWLPVLGLVILWRGGPTTWRLRSLSLVAGGFVLAVTPWLLYVGLHLADYQGQMRFYQPHFRFLDGAFYLSNLKNEYLRYPLGLNVRHPVFGSIVLLIVVPLTTIMLLMKAWRTRETSLAAVGLGLLVPAVLFALLDSEKMFNHVLALFPFAALGLGWGIHRLWAVFILRPGRRRLLRLGVAAALVALAADGVVGILHQRNVAAATTPYVEFEARIGRLITPGALILGSPEFQLGLDSHPYRSMLLPFDLSERQTNPKPVSFEAALERIAPGAILMERPFAQYLESTAHPGRPDRGVYVGFMQYLRRHHGRLAGEIVDSSYFYSPVRVYVLRR